MKAARRLRRELAKDPQFLQQVRPSGAPNASQVLHAFETADVQGLRPLKAMSKAPHLAFLVQVKAVYASRTLRRASWTAKS